jgi:osmoprotectant transport system permease protein
VKINVGKKCWLHGVVATIFAALAFSGAAIAAAENAGVLKIGSKRFTESYILAEVLAQQVKAQAKTKTETRVLQGLGNTAIVYAALKAGSIDLYPEYAGTIAQEILKSATPLSIDEMNRQLQPLGFGVAIPLGFNNGYALAMRSADADKLNIKTLSDLAKKPDQRLGLSNEFIGRADGWKGLSERYKFTQSPISLDHGLAFAALEKNQIDAIDIYTTDAQIEHLKLRVLADDLRYFPSYDAVVLYRLDVPQRFPDAWAGLQKLSNSIDASAMIKMNARAELNSVPFDVIARDHLAQGSGIAPPTGAGERGFISKLFGDDLVRITRQHLLLVLVSVGIATVIAIPLAVLIFPHAKLRTIVLGIAGLMQTVPSLALLAVLISLLGVIGIVPALIALTLYALLPIMRNTCAGLGEVSDGLRQAGKALGMSARDTLMHIELPLALPTIIAGVRTATAISIGTATIAAFIGAGGYGERIVTGLALNDRQLLLAGAIPAAVLALAGELLFEWLERIIIKRQGGK